MEDNNDGEGGGGMPGWLVFILIYGVGNVILYNAFGIVFIPLPGFRR